MDNDRTSDSRDTRAEEPGAERERSPDRAAEDRLVDVADGDDDVVDEKSDDIVRADPTRGSARAEGAAGAAGVGFTVETREGAASAGSPPRGELVEGRDYFCEIGNVQRTEFERHLELKEMEARVDRLRDAQALGPATSPLSLLDTLNSHLQLTDNSPSRNVELTDAMLEGMPEPYTDRYPPVEDPPEQIEGSSPQTSTPKEDTSPRPPDRRPS